jgi:hypothetical protein
MDKLATFFFERYISSVTRFAGGMNYLAKGTKNLLCLGTGKTTAYKGPVLQAGINGSRQMMNAAEGYAGLGEYNAAGLGSVFRVLAALFFVGAGLLRYNGLSLSASASSTPQLLLLASGTYSSGPWQVGLAQPSAPTVGVRATPGTGFTGKVRGSVSVVIWRIRSSTGAKSIKSLPSPVVVADNQTLRVSMPSLDSNGQDRWGIGVTQAGFGFSGPEYKLMEVADSALSTIDGITRSVEIEWVDAQLIDKPLAPTDDFPPPASVFGGALNDVTFYDGCYGDTVTGVSSTAPGSTIVVSKSLNPESFPADNVLFPPEPPINLLRGGDGYYYRLGKNSMCVITYTGGTPALALQIVWPNVGISAPHNACVGEDGRLYLWIGKPARVVARSEEPETNFGDEVADDFEGWADEDVVLGWDARRQMMCYFNKTLDKVMCVNTTTGAWSSPLFLTGKITGQVVSTVTINRDLIFSTNDTSVLRLYKFDGGTGTVVEVMTPWKRADVESDNVFRLQVDWRADNFANDLEMRILINGDDTLANAKYIKSVTLPRSGLQSVKTLKPRVINAKSFALYAKQTCTGGNDAGPEKMVAMGTQSGVAL